MALAPCVRCRQPFYVSCHDASCVAALCPYCEYGDDEPAAGGSSHAVADASTKGHPCQRWDRRRGFITSTSSWRKRRGNRKPAAAAGM